MLGILGALHTEWYQAAAQPASAHVIIHTTRGLMEKLTSLDQVSDIDKETEKLHTCSL